MVQSLTHEPSSGGRVIVSIVMLLENLAVARRTASIVVLPSTAAKRSAIGRRTGSATGFAARTGPPGAVVTCSPRQSNLALVARNRLATRFAHGESSPSLLQRKQRTESLSVGQFEL